MATAESKPLTGLNGYRSQSNAKSGKGDGWAGDGTFAFGTIRTTATGQDRRAPNTL